MVVQSTDRLRQAIAIGAANSMVLKISQVGTVSEALAACRVAQTNGYNVHPCGSRGDRDSIGEFAVGLNAGQLRAGDHNRMLTIEGELGASAAGSREEALGADLLVTVTPGHEVLLGDGFLQPGQHVSLMGADGPGKAEISATELARTRMFCDDWQQASHGGELAHAVEAGLVSQADVGQLGAVLAGEAAGRRDNREITTFDSTGLAIQDLAIALAALERIADLPELSRVAL